MSQNRRNKKVPKPSKDKITKKDKVKGVIALVLLFVAAFLLYFFIFKGNVHKY